MLLSLACRTDNVCVRLKGCTLPLLLFCRDVLHIANATPGGQGVCPALPSPAQPCFSQLSLPTMFFAGPPAIHMFMPARSPVCLFAAALLVLVWLLVRCLPAYLCLPARTCCHCPPAAAARPAPQPTQTSLRLFALLYWTGMCRWQPVILSSSKSSVTVQSSWTASLLLREGYPTHTSSPPLHHTSAPPESMSQVASPSARPAPRWLLVPSLLQVPEVREEEEDAGGAEGAAPMVGFGAM
jgi:hypothetical protein